MKVNIQGRGLVYSLGLNAPVKNIDLTEAQIRRILPVRSLQVFDVESNLLLTTRNFDEFIKTQNAAPVEEPKKEVKKPAKKETPAVVEQVAEPVVETVVNEAPAIEEPVEAVEVVADEVATIEAEEEAIVDYDEDTDAVETTEEPVSGDEGEPVEEAPRKKNKKRR